MLNIPEHWLPDPTTEEMAVFHAERIERRLDRMTELTLEQKLKVLDEIIVRLNGQNDTPAAGKK